MNGIRKFLIASHGTLASGVKSSLEIIVGDVENIFIIEAYVAENTSIEDEVNEVFKNLGNEDELIIFTDLLGGSVTNQMAKFALKDNIHLVSGFNLPLVIEILLSDADTPVTEVIETAINHAKEQIVYVNLLIHSNKGSSGND